MHPQGLGGYERGWSLNRGGVDASIITPLYLPPFLFLLGREAVLHPSTLLLLLSDKEMRRLQCWDLRAALGRTRSMSQSSSPTHLPRT